MYWIPNLEAGRWGVGHPGEADHDDLAIPERREDVGVGAGEGEGLHGQLQRHGGHGVQAEHVAQHQVPVLVPGQQPVVTRQQTCQQTLDIYGIWMLKLCYNFTPDGCFYPERSS